MKKINILFVLLCLLLTISCSDSSYSDKYESPSTTKSVVCGKLMTGTFYAGRVFTANAYWRVYIFDNPIPGKYAQTIGFQNNDNGEYYAPSDSYVNNFWSGFYEVLVQYRLLEDTYNKLPDTDKKDQKVFKDVAEVFLYDHLSRRVDFFGDMPFSKAGYLALTEDVKGSFAPYDKASDLYVMMLDRLKALADDLSYAKTNISATSKTNLDKQDFINYGDLSLWVSYANALRLRIATRLASQGKLAQKGREVIAEILNSQKQLPTNVENMIVLKMQDKDSDTFINKRDFFDGYKDHSIASQKMLDVLTKSVPNKIDPRVAIMYSKNAQGKYRGYSRNETLGEQQSNSEKSEKERVYSRIDTTLVMENQNFLCPIISTAEVDFCRSEAYLNSWANGDPRQAFVDGVYNSVEYYFKQYEISPFKPPHKVDRPSKADVIAYAEDLWDSSTNKLETIITQKWLNFGYMQSTQAWHEICRTGYPKLDYLIDNNAAEYKTPPYRLKYPQKEKANNTTNYNNQITSMGGTDNPYLKLIWQKALQTN